jgi:hypothetical protein
MTVNTISFDLDSAVASNRGIYTGTMIEGQRIVGKWSPELQSYSLTSSSRSACASLPIDGVTSDNPLSLVPPTDDQKPR